MADNGFITVAEAEQASAEPLGLKAGIRRYTTRREPYFFDYVEEQLIEEYGVGVYRRGGLKIHTTIDPELQDAGRAAINGRSCRTRPTRARRSSRSTPPRATSRRWPRAAPTRTATSTSPRRATASRARRSRRSCSSPRCARASTPTRPPTPRSRSTSSCRATGRGRSRPTATATAARWTSSRRRSRSDNTVYAQLDIDLGPKNVRETAEMMGITTPLDGLPAEGLGGLRLGVSPLEMANAYATLASYGIHNEPIAITKVEFPDGKTDELGKPKRERVLPGVGRVRGHEDPRAERAGRHRHGGEHRLRRGRQDRHDRQLQRRVVRRLHAPSRGVGLGRLSERARRDDQRARDQRRRRHVPGADLALVHDGREGNGLRLVPRRPWTSPSSRPFYGKYSSTGTSSDSTYSYSDSYSTAPAPSTPEEDTGGYDPRPLRVAAAGGAGDARPAAGRRRRRHRSRQREWQRVRPRERQGPGLATAPRWRRSQRSASSTSVWPLCRRPTARTWSWRRPGGSPDWLLGPLRVVGGDWTDGSLGGPLFYAGLWLALALWAVVVIRARGLAPRTAIAAVVAVHLVFLLAPPLLSQDVFSYIAYARLGVEHDLNPYEHAPDDVPGDAVYPYAGSKTATSAYGPLFTLVDVSARRARRADRLLDPQGPGRAGVARARGRRVANRRAARSRPGGAGALRRDEPADARARRGRRAQRGLRRAAHDGRRARLGRRAAAARPAPRPRSPRGSRHRPGWWSRS